MNYFVLANGVLYLGATWYSFTQTHFLWGVVWLCYAVSAFALAVAELP